MGWYQNPDTLRIAAEQGTKDLHVGGSGGDLDRSIKPWEETILRDRIQRLEGALDLANAATRFWMHAAGELDRDLYAAATNARIRGEDREILRERVVSVERENLDMRRERDAARAECDEMKSAFEGLLGDFNNLLDANAALRGRLERAEGAVAKLASALSSATGSSVEFLIQNFAGLDAAPAEKGGA